MTTTQRTPDAYTRLTRDEIALELREIGSDAATYFGRFDARALNWRPDATRWSVAQCLEHLVTANRLMFQAAEDAMSGSAPSTLWRRLPLLPAIWGSMLIRSQAPSTSRRFKAPAVAQPASSDISPDIVDRFVQQQRLAVDVLATLDEQRAARTIMTSPFARVITYRVLDGWRLVVAHNHRHIEQAKRVSRTPGFPGAA